MAQIKDTNVIQTPAVVIDPRFFTPPDVIDMRSGSSETNPEDLTDEVTIDTEPFTESISSPEPTQDVSIIDDGAPTLSTTLPPPSWMTIISQTVRFATDGKAVVDVVIEVEDVSGATSYETRMSRQ